MMRIKERMKTLRESKNLTQEALSSVIGIPAPSLSRYEAGKSMPNAVVIYKYCCFFKVSADYLLGISDIRKSVDEFIKDSEETLLKVKAFDSLRCTIENFEKKAAMYNGKKDSDKIELDVE